MIFAVCLCICLSAGAAAVVGCGQSDVGVPASPLPSLSARGASPPAAVGQMQAGVGHDRTVHFRTASGQGLSIRILKATWRESVQGSDGTMHENVLAVAVQVSVSGPGTDVGLGIPAQLEIGNGTSRRSGRFPVAGALDMGQFQPGEVRRGWLAFENVDWDALRGHSAPAGARLRMYAYLDEGMGIGEWLVSTGSGAAGASRRVTLPALGASVGFNIM
jgi:hypothetical protein